MRFDKAIQRCASVVERSLKKTFPQDYDSRCLYAALGMHHLTKKLGYRPNMVRGDFSALVVAKDNSQATFQGYNRVEADNNFAHYWCDVEDHIVDLGPSLLPKKSRFPAANVPIVMWPKKHPLPNSLMYTPKIAYHPDAINAMEPAIMTKVKNFLQTCDQKFAAQKGQPKLKNWLVSGPKSIASAAARGDLWAKGTIHIEGNSNLKRAP